MMPVFVGIIVGLLATTNRGELFAQQWPLLLLMFLTVAVARPITFVLDTLLRNHTLQPILVNRTRWQSHFHVIRQSWTFFQNDFAGRIGTKILQSGEAVETAVNGIVDAVWYAAVFVVVAIFVLARMDWILLVPIVGWLALYGVLFATVMPRIAKHSEELLSEVRSVMTGRMVDSYTNIQTLKTFSHGGARGQIRLRVRASTTPSSIRKPDARLHLYVVDAVRAERRAGGVDHLAGAGRLECSGTLTTAAVATAVPVRAADHEHVGLDPRCRVQHLPADRHCAGLDGHHRAADHTARCAGRRRSRGQAGRDRLRRRDLQLLARRARAR